MHCSRRSFSSLNMSPHPCSAHTASVSPSFISSSCAGRSTEASLSPAWKSLRPVRTSASRQPYDHMSAAVPGGGG